MLRIELLKKDKDFDSINISRSEYVEHMHEYLGQFGDPKPDIDKSITYAFSDNEAEGGFLLAAFYEDKFVGGLIMNKTGMSGYIPENILVYVAVDSSHRGKGFGGQIVKESFKHADGNVKLHVEYENPAKRLYERIGFKSKYAEMRYDNK